MNQETVRVLAAVILEVIYVAAGLIICIIGRSLLEKGITGKFAGEGEVASRRFRFVTSSPGLVFLIAGLLIVVVAILTQVNIPVSVGASSDGSNENTSPTGSTQSGHSSRNNLPTAKAPLDQLAQIATFTLLKSESNAEEERNKAYAYYVEAQNATRGQDRAAALENFVRAIALDPALLKRALKDKTLSTLLRDPKLESYVRARMSVAQKSQHINTISANVRQIIAKLEIKAMTGSLDIDENKTDSLIERLPQQSGRESVTDTQETLRGLIDHDPAALIDVLEEPEYRWLTEDGAISKWLEANVSDY